MNDIVVTASTKRYLWIDLAKAVSITLIVWFHCPPDAYGFTQLSIPLFFFLSGLLFDFEKYPSFVAFVKHRSKQLLVPYFYFFALLYLFWLSVGRSISSPEEEVLPLYAPLLEYLYGRPVSICMPLWFVACLFAMQCIFYLFKKVGRVVTLCILFLLRFLPYLLDMSNTPWMLDGVFEALIFYGVASLFKREILLFLENMKFFFLMIILLAISILLNYTITDVSNEYLKSLLNLLLSFSLIFPFVFFMKMITNKFGIHCLITYIAANTIIILVCHTYVIRMADIVITQIVGFSPDFYDNNFLFKFGLTMFIMISMFVPIYVINKYFPFMIGKGRLFERKEKKLIL